MEALLVITHLPDAASAAHLARNLVKQHLAACAQVLAPCRSFYHWQDTLEEAEEVPVLLKTTRTRYAALEAAIRLDHPYQLPEIIAFAVGTGLPEYLAWVTAETHSL